MKLINTSIALYILIIIIFITAYIMNLYKLLQLDFKAPFKAEAIRVIGIFTPISIVTGFMDIKE